MLDTLVFVMITYLHPPALQVGVFLYIAKVWVFHYIWCEIFVTFGCRHSTLLVSAFSILKDMKGRKKLFKNKKELEEKVQEFWAYVKEEGVTPTLSRLASICGCDRRTLVNYSHDDQFFPTIQKVKADIESHQEEFLYSGKSVAGAIFSLKNNYQWEDKTQQEVDQTIKVPQIKWDDDE